MKTEIRVEQSGNPMIYTYDADLPILPVGLSISTKKAACVKVTSVLLWIGDDGDAMQYVTAVN